MRLSTVVIAAENRLPEEHRYLKSFCNCLFVKTWKDYWEAIRRAILCKTWLMTWQKFDIDILELLNFLTCLQTFLGNASCLVVRFICLDYHNMKSCVMISFYFSCTIFYENIFNFMVLRYTRVIDVVKHKIFCLFE